MISQVVLNGFITGMIIALPAIALTLTYGILKFPNFAIGAMLTVGAYFAFIANAWLQLPMLWAAIVAALALAITSVGVDRLVFQPLRERSSITLLVASMGVSFVLENVARFVFGNSARSFEVAVARPQRVFDLRINMEAAISAQQYSTVSLIAAEIDRSVRERLDLLHELSRTITRDDEGGDGIKLHLLERQGPLLRLFNLGVIVTNARGIAVASIPEGRIQVGTDYGTFAFTAEVVQHGRSVVTGTSNERK